MLNVLLCVFINEKHGERIRPEVASYIFVFVKRKAVFIGHWKYIIQKVSYFERIFRGL